MYLFIEIEFPSNQFYYLQNNFIEQINTLRITLCLTILKAMIFQLLF
jgi:hypothetical protein